ncbi:MAG: carboxypeptidase regulatory-like domain-containing protein [Planctomycetes bacterium]|nr:carboxypeptidase regulatory-like domain-containing protein [Planctomycetota bacterium]
MTLGSSLRRFLAVETDGDGQCALRGLEPGLQVAQIRHPDYLTAHQLLEIPTGGGDPPLYEVRLHRGHRLRGRVDDERGNPVALAGIIVSRAADEGPERSRATSGGDGTFVLSALAPGTWSLSAWAAGRRSIASRPVEIGSEDDIRLVLPADRPATVWTRRADGSPLPGARVTPRVPEAPPGSLPGIQPSRRSDDRGQAALHGLPADPARKVILEGDHNDYPDTALETTVEELMQGNVALVFEEPAEIEALVVDAEGAAVAGARVALAGPVSRELSSTSAGSVIFRRLPRAEFTLEAWTERRGSSGPVCVDLSSTPPPAMPVPLVLRPGPGVLAGRVVDGDGLPLALVPVAAEGPEGSARTATGEDGSFRIEGLAEGTYRVSAGTRERGTARIGGVSTPAGDLLLRLEPPGSVFGFILDPGPARGFSIAAQREEPADAEPSSRVYRFSSKEPRFEIGGLPPGRYRILLMRAGRSEAEAAGVEVRPGERTGPILLRIEG